MRLITVSELALKLVLQLNAQQILHRTQFTSSLFRYSYNSVCLKIKSAHLKCLKPACFSCFKNKRAAFNLLSNHSSLVEDVLSAFSDKSYKSGVHSEQGIVSLNSRCRNRQNTESTENHSPALLYLRFSNSPPQDWHSNLSVEANLFSSVSSFSGLCTLTCGKRHPGLISISTRDNLPEILLPDNVGPAVDAIGEGAHTEEGGVWPFIELVRGV